MTRPSVRARIRAITSPSFCQLFSMSPLTQHRQVGASARADISSFPFIAGDQASAVADRTSCRSL